MSIKVPAIPISRRAVTQRISRRLAKSNMTLILSRNGEPDVYTVHPQNGVRRYESLLALAAELKVLKPWESC